MVDLHDLSVKQARAAVDQAVVVGTELDAGAICFVVGRGRHGLGGSKLGPAVAGTLRQHCRGRPWRTSPGPAGRLILVVDPVRAPASATGRPGVIFWVGALSFLAAATFASPVAGAVVGVLLAAWAWALHRDRQRDRRRDGQRERGRDRQRD